MMINIDIEKLNSLGITPNQYMICYLIHFGEKDIFFQYRRNFNYPITTDIQYLLKKGYLINTSVNSPEDDILPGTKLDELYAAPLFNDLVFVDSNDAFDALRKAYPLKDGLRKLHNDVAKCRDKYTKLISGDMTLHQHILKCIAQEKQVRIKAARMKQFMPGWKMLSTYINQQGWKLYEEDLEEKTQQQDEGDVKIYGGEFK